MTTRRSFLAGALVLIAFYAFFGFIAWDFNPGNWDPVGRALAAFVAGTFAALTAADRL